jgi:hypothetical protein
MNPQTYLTVLTFVGLVVGTVGVLIAQLTKTSVEVDGTMRKRLTRPGRWAFAISLLGFAGLFSSELFKTSIQAQQRAQVQIDAALKEQKERETKDWQGRSETLQGAIKADTKTAVTNSEKSINETIEASKREEASITESRERVLRDNLLHEVSLYGKLSAAGTPLTSLTITFTIENVPQAVRNKLQKELVAASKVTAEPWVQDLFEHHNIDDDDAQAFVQARIYEEAVQPFIDYIATGRLRKEHALLVVSLDRRYSALACLGWIDEGWIETDRRWTETVEEDSREHKISLLPSSILVEGEIDSRNPGSRGNLPRKKIKRPSFSIDVKGTSVSITLDLTLQSLRDALLRYPANSPATAGLNDHIEVFTWSPTNEGEMSADEVNASGSPELPFDTQRVRHSLTDVELHKDRRLLPEWRDSSTGDDENWQKGNEAWVRGAPVWMHRISVRIVPNGIEQVAKTYKLRLSSAGYPLEGSRENEPRGYVQIWHGEAR